MRVTHKNSTTGFRILAVLWLLVGLCASNLHAGTWTGGDIGSVGVVGTDSLSGGVYTIKGSGTDIGGMADACHYAYQALTADGFLEARVTNVQNSSSAAKAGVMIRQSTDVGSIQVMLAAVPSTGSVLFLNRGSSGGTTTSTSVGTFSVTTWLRVVKDGTLISTYQSSDGVNWTFTGLVRLSGLTNPVEVGFAVTSGTNSALCTAIFDNITISGQSSYAPTSPWADQDIGTTGQLGQVHVENSSWSLYGAGSGVSGTADSFHFAYQPMLGSGVVMARVDGLTSSTSAAGVVMRQDLSAGSVEAAMMLNKTGGVKFVTRTTSGATVATTSGANVSAPYWVKLVRTGNVFYGYQSSDGSAWTLVGSQTVTMTGTVEAGVATTNGSTSALALGLLDRIVVLPSGNYLFWGDISSGAYHNLYLQTNGNVWAWGANESGELGDGTTTQRTSPVLISALSGIAAVSAGDSHSLALANDGTVFAWGNNDSAQLGDGTTVPELAPEHLTGLSGIVAISSGAAHSLALRNDGSVWSWGNDASGQLGDGTTTTRGTPSQITTLTGIVAISAGASHSLALKSDGSVWAWGFNSSGELGDGSVTTRLLPVQVSGLSNIVAISAGTDHSLALDIDGNVWSWGGNSCGELGSGGTTNSSIPVAITTLGGITSIKASNFFSLALTGSGLVEGWGNDSSGQLGINTTTQQNTPVAASVLTGAVAISAGSFHSTALKPDAIWTWGDNSCGQLGTGNFTPSLVPAPINPSVPVITSSLTATGLTGSSFSYQITANNLATSFGASGLPAGLSVNTATGVISGTPTSTGNSSITISARNITGVGSAVLNLTVNLGAAPVINSSGTASGIVGNSFSYTITATNSPTSFSATGLPAGLTVNTATGAITGTPTRSGTSTVALGASNTGGTGTASLTLTIVPQAPVITSALTATATKSAAYSGYTITANNSPTSFSASGLPAGLTVNTSTGAITGTPTTVGVSSVTLGATNAGGTGNATLTFTVNSPVPSITSVTTATGTTGTAFNYTITASNSPTGFQATGLPGGLTVNTTSGAISGTPAQAGTFAVSLGATNASGTGAATLTLTINSPKPVITSATSATGINGSAFTYTITANNSPTSFNATGLPAGLSVSTSSGVISGTPTATGTSSIALSAINASGTGTATLSLTINAPKPVISSGSTATGVVGTAFSGYTIAASNSPTSFSATGLPPGLTVSTSTGAIAGTPTTAGTYPVTMGATNASGTGTATLTFTVNSPTPAITSLTSALGTVSTAFSYSITASNSPTSFSATGLPSGLSVNTTTGKISGTPTAAATTSVTIGATNASGTGSATLSLTINPALPVISSATTASGTVGTVFGGYTIVASNSPTSYSATGLPSGLTITATSGAISGTPTTAGTFSVSLGATNAGGTGTLTLTLTIKPLVPVISSPLTTTATMGVAYSGYTIAASNNPTSFTASGLPAGLAINTATGAITGTPSATGTSSVTLGATNAGGTGNATLSFTVNPAKPVIYSATSESATINVAFNSYKILATNSPTSYGATGLPTGLAVSTTTGAISGTPTATGTSTVTLTATNASGSGTATLTFAIKSAAVPVISSATTATGTKGTAFTGYTVTASNTPTSYSATGLPAGLSLNTTSGAITGTPTAAGVSYVQLGAANANGSGSATLTFAINSPTPVINSPTTATAVKGVAFSGYAITATNNPVTLGATGLPTGLSVNTTSGVISGTPTTTGASTVTLSATNPSGTGTATLTFTINPPLPVITSATTASGTTGTAFSYTIVASNTPTSFSATGLPAGLALNTTSGAITGTPTTAGTYSVTLGALNVAGTGTATLTLTINPPVPVITSAATTTGVVGSAFSGYTITANNSPTSFNATGLPTGLSVNTTTGAITGTPTTAGPVTVSLTATNAAGNGTKSLTFTVNNPKPVISSGTTASASLGVAFPGYTIMASNSPASFSATGLPAGLSLNTTSGAISGTATQAGTYPVTIGATNPTGTGTATLTITVSAATPVVNSLLTAVGTNGASFSYNITATNSPQTFSASGLPAGLSVNTTTGKISGTPTATGTSSVTLGATNGSGTGNATLTLTINDPKPVISSATTASGTTGSAFSYSIVASNSPTSYGATGLPAGLSINSSTGVISGTPTSSGTSSVTLGASNATATGTLTLTITISPPTPVITSLTSALGTTGSSFTYSITASNSPTSYSASGLPAGLSVSTSTGKITGTPTATGTSTVTIGATNASGTGSATLLLTVNPPTPVISSSGTASGTTGNAFGYTITGSNSPTGYSATGLPVGFTYDPTTGQITGSSTAAGSFTITVGASNASGSGTKSLTVTITPPAPVITSASTASGLTGNAFSYTITATNLPTSFHATGLPSGLSVNTTTGMISGAPAAAGVSTVTISATNAGGTGTATLSLTVTTPTPIFNTPATLSATQNAYFSYTVTASNNPTSFGATGLPAGLAINTSTGVISGVPSTPGTSTASLSATNSGATGTANLVIQVAAGVPVSSGLSVWLKADAGVTVSNGTVSQWTDQTASQFPIVQTDGGSQPGIVTDTATGRLALSFDGNRYLSSVDDILTGSTDVTIFTVSSMVDYTQSATSVIVGNALSNQGRACYNDNGYQAYNDGAHVGDGGSEPTNGLLNVSTMTYSQSSQLASFYVNGVANQTATVTSSTINGGMTIGSLLYYGPYIAWNGEIAEVIVYNRALTTAERQQVEQYLINKYSTPIMTGAQAAIGTVGTPFSYTIGATNSPTAFTGAALPPGLTLNPTTGVISGTPTAAGVYPVTLGTANSYGGTTATLVLTINPAVAPTINSSPVANATVGVPFTYTISANYSPTSFSATGLPAGLTLNTTSGVISGTPTASIIGTVSLGATNASGTGTSSLTITISAGLPVTSGLSAWYTADAGVAVYGGQITQWNDQSPNHYTMNQNLGDNAPTLSLDSSSGRPVATFNGNQYLENGATLTDVNDVTIITVASTVNPSSGGTAVMIGNTFGTQSARGYADDAGAQAFLNGESTQDGGPSETDSLLHVNTVTYAQSSGTATFYKDGVANSTASAPGGALGAQFTIGSILYYGPYIAWDGGIAQVLVYDRVLTTSERQQVETYLGNKYSGHIPVITSAPTINAAVGSAFSYSIAATNSPTNFAALGLPAGVTFNPATGLISGTASTVGVLTVNISATNASGTGYEAVTLNINPPAPVITSATAAGGAVGAPFNYLITATNTPYHFGAAGLPAGLTLDPNSGQIAGIPTAPGTATVTLSATNAGGTATATLLLTMTTPAPPVITSATSSGATLGVAYTYSITATNNPASFGASGLPSGLTINTATGAISGTPTAAGTSNVTLSATNTGGTGTAALTLTVTAPPVPVITSPLSAGATKGVSFSYTVRASNLPTSFSASGYPAGLSFNAVTGVLSGTPTATGNSSVTIGATNAGGTGTAALALTVSAYPVPVITSPTTAGGATGTAFSYSISATNSPTSYSATGLPAGLSVNTTTGAISGTPSATGTSTVTLGATNSGGTGTSSLSLTISSLPVPVISSSSTAFGTISIAFSYTIVANNTPTSYAATGLPAGLSINTTSGVISGTPSATGTSNVTLSATNSHGTGTLMLALTISAPIPVITGATTTNATQGVALTYQITATNSPTSYAATGLPSGLSINTTTGAITGTPSTVGTTSVTIKAINSSGTGTATWTVVTSTGLPVGSGLAAWFKADSGVITSGTSVTQWTDLTTNNIQVTQSAGTSAPTQGTDAASGYPVLSFNGSQYLTTGAKVATNDVTIITVASNSIPAGTSTPLVVGNATSSNTARASIVDSGKQAFSNGAALADGSSVATDSSLGLTTVTYSESSSTAAFYFRGVSNGTATLAAGDVSAGLTVGSMLYYGPYLAWKGNIAEVVIYNRVLTPTERQQVELYYANKYSIYAPGASWIASYSTDIQTLVNANHWGKAQADSYAQWLATTQIPVPNGLAAWFSANAGTSVSGTMLTQWADQTYNGYVLNPNPYYYTTQPQVVPNGPGGQNAVLFNGGYMSSGVQVPINDVTIIAVAAAAPPTRGGVIASVGNSFASGTMRGLGYSGGKLSFEPGAPSGFPSYLQGGAAPASSQLVCDSVTYSASSGVASFYADGQSAGTITTSTSPVGAGMTIGPWNGNVMEVLIFNRVLSPTERAQMENYLANRDGIYYPGASWLSAFSPPMQAQISQLRLTKAQANAYATFATAHPQIPSAGLACWLSADTNVMVDGSNNVSSWNDQSLLGVNASQATSTARPALVPAAMNGKPVVRFDGSTQSLGLNSGIINLGDGVTTFAVFTPNSPADGACLFSFQCDNFEHFELGFDAANSTMKAFNYNYPNGNHYYVEGLQDLESAPQYYATEQAGGSTAVMYKSGAVVGAINSTYAPLVSLGDVLSANNFIGASSEFYNAKFKGDLAEVLIYNRPLTDAERQQVNLYLANKYSLYAVGASWISAYPTNIQNRINQNLWSKAQTDAYVTAYSTIVANNPGLLTTGLAVWFKPDSGLVTSGGNVTQWTDAIDGKVFSQPNSANQPQYIAADLNGLPGLRFSGNQYLSASTFSNLGFSLNADISIITVCMTTSALTPGGIGDAISTSNYDFCLGGTADGHSRSQGCGNFQALVQWTSLNFVNPFGVSYTDDFLHVLNSTDNTDIGSAGGTYSGPNTYNIEAMTFDPTPGSLPPRPTASIAFYENGIFSGQGSTFTDGTVLFDNLTKGMTLGAQPNGKNGWGGDVLEVLVYDHKLNADEMQQVGSYLSSKYNIPFGGYPYMPPTITPNGGSATSSISVSFSAPPASTVIRYTLDGTTPSGSSTLYTGAFNVVTSCPVHWALFTNYTQVSSMGTSQFYVGDTGKTGLTDAWQNLFFGHTGVDPNAWSPGGSGLTNLQDYLYGYNPNAYSSNGDGYSDSINYLLGISGSSTMIAGNGLTNAQVLALGLNLFSPNNTPPPPPTPPTPNPNDHTPPVITLFDPPGAQLIP